MFNKMFRDKAHSETTEWRSASIGQSSRKMQLHLHPSYVYIVYVETRPYAVWLRTVYFQRVSMLQWWKCGATRILLSLFQVLSVITCCYFHCLIYNKSSHEQPSYLKSVHDKGSCVEVTTLTVD